jgi:hypothetical protein
MSLERMAEDAVREWPTPHTINRKSKAAMTSMRSHGRRTSSPPGLEQMVELSEGHIPHDLPAVEDLPPATRAMLEWPTVRARDWKGSGTDSLHDQAMSWPSPTATDAKESGSPITMTSAAHPGVSLTDVAVHGRSLQDQADRSTTGSRRARLNPRWVAVLQGYPADWLAPDGETS